jgi:hypothetical protein
MKRVWSVSEKDQTNVQPDRPCLARHFGPGPRM